MTSTRFTAIIDHARSIGADVHEVTVNGATSWRITQTGVRGSLTLWTKDGIERIIVVPTEGRIRRGHNDNEMTLNAAKTFIRAFSA